MTEGSQFIQTVDGKQQIIYQTGPPRCRGLLRGIASPAILCHKEPARASKAPLGALERKMGVFCLLLAGSLWHKGAYNRTFPCMEDNYPYAIKNQRGALDVTSWFFMA